jgi:hypothetical protein
VDSIAQAIAQMEGYNSAGTLAQRNNNPGNLRAGPGQTGTSGGFAVFPDPSTGWAALDSQVQTNINRGLTLQQFFAGGNGYPGYAPSADANNPTAYAAFVAAQTGAADVNTPISSLLAGDQGSGSTPPVDASGMPIDTSGTVAADTSGLSGSAWIGLAAAGLGLVLWASR